MRTIAQLVVGLLTFAVPVLATSNASAGLDACGDIHVEANAQCEVVVGAECDARCEPVRFEAACAADLQASCEGQCDASFEASCTASCQGSCQAECEVNPPSFSCSAECNANCGANCDAQCSASGNKGECRASCEASCSAECDASCSATPGSASCEAKCEASCEGECTAEANLDCQVECQASGYVDCKADLQGGCEVRCDDPEGALFCDGQYVDAGNNLEKCVAALEAALNIEVEGYAHGECSGNKCEAEAGVSCALMPGSPGSLDSRVLAALAAGLGVAVVARRRRRR